MGVLNRLFEMFVICISHFLYTFKCQHSDIFLQVDFSCTGFLTLADCTLCQFSPQVLNHTRYPSWIRSTPGIIFFCKKTKVRFWKFFAHLRKSVHLYFFFHIKDKLRKVFLWTLSRKMKNDILLNFLPCYQAKYTKDYYCAPLCLDMQKAWRVHCK